jgi:hypothetical protein
MLSNPFLPAPGAARAWAEGFTKGFAAINSPEPGENVSGEDIDAFNQGVVAGEESSRSGIGFGDPCIAASEEHGPLHVPGMTINALEIAHGVWEARHLATLAAGVASVVVALIELAVTLPVHTLPPEQVLPSLAQPMIDELVSYGMEPIELFCGASLDPGESGCEIRVSPIFPFMDLAREAAIGMGRPQWVVVSWSPITDQSSSRSHRFDIVDSGLS